MVTTRVLRRKKGKKFYFYLQYSFREGRKVITKEKYLGLEIPKNIEQIKEEIEKEQKRMLYSKLVKIRKNFQKYWNSLPKSVQEKEKGEIAIAFTYNTNAIEGSTITLPETREILQDKIAPKKPLRDIKETESHAKVFLKILSKKEGITKELLLIWHKEIFGETKQDIAGIFRTYLIRIGSYVAPDWQDVEKLISELIKFISNSKLNPIELAACVHYRFEKIHPFGDGNGRIGRLLMNHILWHAGYPMLIIEYKKRRAYYKALEKDEEYFVKYFIRKYLSIHKKR
jgi:Fic family protein